jgi:DeoR family transcriptional regulator, suf operon transcriptional repressor
MTRRALLNLLKKRGEMAVESLADELGMTVSGARQQLAALERDGLVSFTEVRPGPGRPRRVFRLTPAADALYPRAYAELTNELLQYVEDADPALIESIFERRRQRRIEGALARIEGLDFRAKVAELARILDEDGYLAEWTEQDDGTFFVTERNCAIFGVAMKYGQACGSELDFIRKVMTDATVDRVSHMAAGAHSCSYHIRPHVMGSFEPPEATGSGEDLPFHPVHG